MLLHGWEKRGLVTVAFPKSKVFIRVLLMSLGARGDVVTTDWLLASPAVFLSYEIPCSPVHPAWGNSRQGGLIPQAQPLGKDGGAVELQGSKTCSKPHLSMSWESMKEEFSCWMKHLHPWLAEAQRALLAFPCAEGWEHGG